jgi:lipoprotein-releasing system permease protein
MSGFQREIRDRMLQMAAHATVSGYGEPLTDWPHAWQLATQDKRVAGAAPYIETQGLLRSQRNQPAIIRGVLPEEEARFRCSGEKMVDGRLDVAAARAASTSCSGASSRCGSGVNVGDSVGGHHRPAGHADGRDPAVQALHVSGLFEAGYNEFDKGLAGRQPAGCASA